MTTHRQTGRTTRMLLKAIELAREGKRVTVVVENLYQARELTQRCQCLARLNGDHSIELPAFTTTSAGIDWAYLCFKDRYRGDEELLVDHYVIEKRFERLLQMLHAFDLPSSTASTP